MNQKEAYEIGVRRCLEDAGLTKEGGLKGSVGDAIGHALIGTTPIPEVQLLDRLTGYESHLTPEAKKNLLARLGVLGGAAGIGAATAPEGQRTRGAVGTTLGTLLGGAGGSIGGALLGRRGDIGRTLASTVLGGAAGSLGGGVAGHYLAKKPEPTLAEKVRSKIGG